MAKIKLTKENLPEYLRELGKWAEENGFDNVKTIVESAAWVIEKEC